MNIHQSVCARSVFFCVWCNDYKYTVLNVCLSQSLGKEDTCRGRGVQPKVYLQNPHPLVGANVHKGCAYLNFLKMAQALCPPNPNVLLIAALTVRSCAVLKVKLRL